MTRRHTSIPPIALLAAITLLLGSALTPHADSHAAPADDPVICDVEPARGPAGRALILVQGMLSRSSSEHMWDNLVRELSDLYGGYVYYSYSGLPHSYTADETVRSIAAHDVPLLQQLILSCSRAGWTTLDIIGHSKGGVVAMEYVKAYGLSGGDGGLVRHVVTLDAPVNGSELAKLLLHSPGSTVPAPWWGTPLAGGDTSTELAQMYERRESVRLVNIEAAQQRAQIGACVLTLSNNQDLAISQADALIEGYGKSYDLGADLSADLGRRLGHHLTLDVPNETSEMQDIRSCLAGQAPPGLVTARPLPGLSESLLSFIRDTAQRSLLFLSHLWQSVTSSAD